MISVARRHVTGQGHPICILENPWFETWDHLFDYLQQQIGLSIHRHDRRLIQENPSTLLQARREVIDLDDTVVGFVDYLIKTDLSGVCTDGTEDDQDTQRWQTG